METGPVVAAQLQPWVFIPNVGAESTAVPTSFLTVMRSIVAFSGFLAGELDKAGNARPAFLMRLSETKVSAGCHKVR